jgi:hypothetical protein
VSTASPREPLIQGVSQYEVDFVIPRAGIDIPVGIDPFLLFKSRDPELRGLHTSLISVFNSGIELVRQGALGDARRLFDFPEVPEIGFGYTQESKRGSGLGSHLTGLILDTVVGSPSLQERGVKHVEEMQLLSAGIGPDRVSDIAANILKSFLIQYTQRQAVIWKLAVSPSVPVTHIFDHSSGEWQDSHEDLPVSKFDGSPILLVPRRLVRSLPWINYDDFLRTEFKAYLSSRRQPPRHLNPKAPKESEPVTPQPNPAKEGVVSVTRSDMAIVDRYVKAREDQKANARPTLDYIDDDRCKEAELLKARLFAINHGREQATEYQGIVLEILNYLFNPELIDGQPEVRTVDGTERRDIIFTNDSDESFWDYVRTAHDAIILMFETKNTLGLDIPAINQTATYLGDRIGRMGVIVTRRTPSDAIQRKIFSVWNDSAPNRKIMLVLTDEHLCDLLDLCCRGGSPTAWMQRHYRAFRTAVQ